MKADGMTKVAVRFPNGAKTMGTIPVNTIDKMRAQVAEYVFRETGKPAQAILILVPKPD